MTEERIREIEERARTEKKTADYDYNEGARDIRKYGYKKAANTLDVIYWCKCNGFI